MVWGFAAVGLCGLAPFNFYVAPGTGTVCDDIFTPCHLGEGGSQAADTSAERRAGKKSGCRSWRRPLWKADLANVRNRIVEIQQRSSTQAKH